MKNSDKIVEGENAPNNQNDSKKEKTKPTLVKEDTVINKKLAGSKETAKEADFKEEQEKPGSGKNQKKKIKIIKKNAKKTEEKVDKLKKKVKKAKKKEVKTSKLKGLQEKLKKAFEKLKISVKKLKKAKK
ncbi:MAG: hypothetical protein Q8S54_09825 [Bacteroidota bacterium]|nr:hypothetical protein [Odoribacter sp.]MDP3643473.1 hypothetical protein [Bacteroidota bacterium]